MILEFETVPPVIPLIRRRGEFSLVLKSVCSGEVLIKLISLGFVQGKN